MKTEFNKAMGIKEWAMIIVLSVIWGGSFFFIEIAVRQMTTLTIVMCRVGLASIILMGFVYLTGRKMDGLSGYGGLKQCDPLLSDCMGSKIY